MKKIILSLSLLCFTSLLSAQEMYLSSGWQMKGTEYGFSNMQAFNKSCINTVWSYDQANKSWKAYSPDSSISQQITDDRYINKLSNLNPDDGFWINANSSCTITKEGNVSAPIVIYQTNSLYALAKPFTLDMIANKTFKYDTDTNHNITFNANGFAKLGDGNITLRSDGVLVSQSNDNCSQYVYKNEEKVLAKDDSIGYVTVARSFFGDNTQYDEYVSSIIFTDAVENPVDMSTKLPYMTYQSYDLKNKHAIRYNADGTIVHLNKDGIQSDYNDNNFTVEGGKIVTHSESNDTNYAYENNSTIQIIFNIGDYDILKSTYNGYSKSKTINYTDENNNSVSLELNSSIATFNDLFAITHNKINNDVYNADGTITDQYSTMENQDNNCNVNRTFTLSNDGKELTICWGDEYCQKQVIENGFISNIYSDTYYETVKTTPYF